MITVLLFILFAGMAIGCAVAVVALRNPLYSAISLIGVFVGLAALYLTLAAPFIAAVQIIVYAGAIMVLVVFVIMLLNVEEEEHRPLRLRILVPISIVLAALLMGEAAFILYFVGASASEPVNAAASTVGSTGSIGTGLFTEYLLPFEVTSVLILMAIVGAMSLARRDRTLTTVGASTVNGEDGRAGALNAPVSLRIAGEGANDAFSTETIGRAMAQEAIRQLDTKKERVEEE